MELKKISDIVKDLLINHKACRKDDFALYLKVLEALGIDTNISIKHFLNGAKGNNMPIFESVTRARRAIQSKYPELNDKTVKNKRLENVEKYVKYNREMKYE